MLTNSRAGQVPVSSSLIVGIVAGIIIPENVKINLNLPNEPRQRGEHPGVGQANKLGGAQAHT